MTAPRRTPNPEITDAPEGGKFSKVVHAYRRLPHMLGEPPKEHPVVVELLGHKVKFMSNEAGHIVATVTNAQVYKHLTTKIPEAYIEYKGGDNIPARPSANQAPAEPEGQYVLVNGKETMVLDEMSDEAVREFAASVGLDEEALPAVLEGDTLKQAVVNSLRTK